MKAGTLSRRSLQLVSDRIATCPICGHLVFIFKELEDDELHGFSPCMHVVFFYMEIADIRWFDHVDSEFAARYLKKLKENWQSITGEETYDISPVDEEAFLSGRTGAVCHDNRIHYVDRLLTIELFPGAKAVHIITMDDAERGKRPCGGMDPPWYAIGFVERYDA